MDKAFADKIIVYHNQGINIEEQARLLGTNKDRISQARRQLGLAKPPKAVSDAEKSRVAQLIQEGLSFSRIAAALLAEFNVKRTRSAIAGIASRLGVKTTKSPEAIFKEIHEHRLIRAQKQLAAGGRAKRKGEPKPKPEYSDEDLTIVGPLFEGIGKPMADLTSQDCRWPLQAADGSYTFCGCKVSCKSYCEKHYRKAYRDE